ncbi:MAG: hypothetical protein Q8Q81_13315 [Oxalobacteraceae bacterium]|jgi:hypothetical protein|nr:hypothetical protein [Oxalobacteraceae bacterium]
MALLSYTKGNFKAEVDVLILGNDRFQGTVLLKNQTKTGHTEVRHNVETVSSSSNEALDEAKALAHRLLAAI